jgi:hypothetical protein
MQITQQKKVLAVGIPLLLALGAAITQSIAIHRAVKTGRFLVLKDALKEGATLERENLATVELAEKFIPKGAIRSENLEATVKMKTRRPLASGKLLFTDDLTGSLRRIEREKGHLSIPIVVNRASFSTHELDVGDRIRIVMPITRAEDKVVEYPEIGPFKILMIDERGGEDSSQQRIEISIPEKETAVIKALAEPEASRKIVNITRFRESP